MWMVSGHHASSSGIIDHDAYKNIYIYTYIPYPNSSTRKQNAHRTHPHQTPYPQPHPDQRRIRKKPPPHHRAHNTVYLPSPTTAPQSRRAALPVRPLSPDTLLPNPDVCARLCSHEEQLSAPTRRSGASSHALVATAGLSSPFPFRNTGL